MVPTVELIDAKQSLAGDLCPLGPTGDYLVTNVSEGRLKRTSLMKTTVDDETTAGAG